MKEIFNFRRRVTEHIKLFLEQEHYEILDSHREPLFFARVANATIEPYSKIGAAISKKPRIYFNDTYEYKNEK